MTSDSQCWLVTGANGGLGRCITQRILGGGHRVIACSRDTSWLDSLQAQAGEERIQVVQMDVTNAAQVCSAIEAAFAPIDVVVNGAGCAVVGSVEEIGEQQARAIFETNFWGMVNVVRAVLPQMRERRKGHIVNISAVAGVVGEPGFSIYGASKFALEGFSECLRLDTQHLGIGVTIVEPGPFRTPFISRSLQAAEGQIADYDPSSGRFAELLRKLDGKQIGDPEKAADRIVAAVESGNPPHRLMLGRFAFDRIGKHLERVAADLEASKMLAPTEFSAK